MTPCVCIDWRSVVDVEDGFDAYVLKKCSATVLLVVDKKALEEEVACWCREQGGEEELVERFHVEISGWRQICLRLPADACSQRWRRIYPPGLILPSICKMHQITLSLRRR